MKMLCICCWQVCKRLRRHQSKWCVCTHNLLMLSTWADLVSKRSFVVQGLSSQPGHNSIQDVQRNYRPMLGWDMSRASEKTVDHCLLSLVMQLLGTWNSNIQQAWFGLIWHILTSWVIKAWPKVSLGDGLNIRNLKIMQASPLGMAVPAEGPSSASALKLNSVHLRCKWKGFVVIGCALIHLVLFLCCVWISDMDCRLWRLPPVFARAQSRPWLVAFNMALTCVNHFFVNSATSWQNQVHSCEDECWARHGEDQLSEMRCASSIDVYWLWSSIETFSLSSSWTMENDMKMIGSTTFKCFKCGCCRYLQYILHILQIHITASYIFKAGRAFHPTTR